MGSAFFTIRYLQSVLGKSALEAALWSLPASVLIGVAAPAAAQLVQRGIERAYVVPAGFLVSAGGYGLPALADTDSLWLVPAACGVMASGIVVAMSPLTDLALSPAPVEKAGAAPALARETLGGAPAVAAEPPGRAGDALATATREAFTSGMRGAAIAGAVLLVGAAGLAAAGLRHVRVRPEAPTENAGRADTLSPSGV